MLTHILFTSCGYTIETDFFFFKSFYRLVGLCNPDFLLFLKKMSEKLKLIFTVINILTYKFNKVQFNHKDFLGTFNISNLTSPKNKNCIII